MSDRGSLADLVPQHGYPAALERGRNPFAEAFARCSDEQWLEVLKRSLHESEIDGVEFPRFPQRELQERIHGHSGAHSIEEAFEFYRYCRDHTYVRPDPDRGLRLLDFGAGWGRTTRPFMRDFGPSAMFGYEPNLLFCVIARSLNPYVGFLHGSHNASGALPRDWFDVVVSWSVFTHLPEDYARDWLREISRAMRPGGWCVITTWGENFLDRLKGEDERRRRGEEIHWYHDHLLRRLGDPDERLRELRSDAFVFVPSENNSPTYGDAFIGEDSLRRMLEDPGIDFELERGDAGHLAQSAWVLRRSGARGQSV